MPKIKETRQIDFQKPPQLKGLNLAVASKLPDQIQIEEGSVAVSTADNIPLVGSSTKYYAPLPGNLESAVIVITQSGSAGGNFKIKKNGSLVETVAIPGDIAAPSGHPMVNQVILSGGDYVEIDVENSDGSTTLDYMLIQVRFVPL